MVYIAGDNVITSLGFSTAENIRKISENVCGITRSDDKRIPDPGSCCAGRLGPAVKVFCKNSF